ncbi:hypothetical protein Tco_0151790 [Tanacetum coccineum]
MTAQNIQGENNHPETWNSICALYNRKSKSMSKSLRDETSSRIVSDEEIEKINLEAHYGFMAKIQEVLPAESSSIDTPLEQVRIMRVDQNAAIQASFLHQMTSDNNRSELKIQDHSNERSSSKLIANAMRTTVMQCTPFPAIGFSQQKLGLICHGDTHVNLLKISFRDRLILNNRWQYAPASEFQAVIKRSYEYNCDIMPEHSSDTLCIHNEDGNPSSAIIKQQCGRSSPTFISSHEPDVSLLENIDPLDMKKDEIFISQDKYVVGILKKFDFATMKTTSTPMESNKALIKDEEADSMDVHLYRSMIRSLMYLIASRPDIMFAVCACARDSPFDMEAFSDSEYAEASIDRKSTTGGVMDPKSNA